MDTLITNQCQAPPKRPKPKLPIKMPKPTLEATESRSNHVKDMVRRLQERQKSEEAVRTFPAKPRRNWEEHSPSQTFEDLKAIDEDIEKLRKQIEERDKIISALREATEAKDKKLEQLMTEYSKLQMEREPECRTYLNGDARAQERNLTAFSTSPSPPLCNGELCWTDGFVNKNYHEPVYAQLLNDHTALQKIYNELREKLEAKGKELESDENQNLTRKPAESCENGINLIMAEQIRILKEREAQLMSEAEELREQNDLMEFRILELEECRKEEMINEHKHRGEKVIWSERDLEEVSDSGVMSLPTSEDLTSDSELGDTIKNYLHSDAAIVPTLSPQIQVECNELSSSELKQKKPLRNADCLQESGIFEDSEVSEGGSLVGDPSVGKLTKGCQTESVLDKALLEIIDSSCDLILSKKKGYLAERPKTPKSDDLSTEISKLTEIQKRIQEKRENVCELPKNAGHPSRGHQQPQQQSGSTCPHSNSVVFYEERLRQLEDKLKIYESSGDTKDVLLRKRLEKEIELAHRVKELTDRVTSLETINRQIEEEKCEFEEAENDSRFQCQRLEVKVQELMDKNSELELELERHKMMVAGDRLDRRKTSVKGREKQMSPENKMMIEAAMPAIIAWNMFCMDEGKDERSEHLRSEAMILDEKDPVEYCKSVTYPNGEVFQKLEELINDQKKLRVEYEKAEEEARQREVDLKRKIEELEGKSSRDREMLEEMTSYLRALKGENGVSTNESSDSVPSTVDFEAFEEFKQLAENEMKMRRKIDTLERKEQAYLQTLQQADEIWAGMEAEYKKKLAEAEDTGAKLRDRVSELEQKRVELEEALENKELARKVDALTVENEVLRKRLNDLADAELEDRVKTLEKENESLQKLIMTFKEELPLEKKKSEALAMELEMRKEQYIQDKLTIQELGKSLESKNRSLEKIETALHGQISDLTQELAAKSKELSNLEVTVAELREEVETLENKVTELVGALQTARLCSESGSSVQAMTDPRLMDSPRSTSSLCLAAHDISPMKVVRVTCHEFQDTRTSSETSLLEPDVVKNLEVPEPIAEQLVRENSAGLIINESDGLPSPTSVDSSYATRSESEVTLLIGDREHSTREVVVLTENELPVMVILTPEPEPETALEIAIPHLTPAPVVLHLKPEPAPLVKNLFGYCNQSVDVEPSEVGEVEETQTCDDWQEVEPEVDISELSLTNIMLQKTVEKIEEESRLKDLELIELQRTVSEIRREQQELEVKLLEQTQSNPVLESKATEVDESLDRTGTGVSATNVDEDEDDDDVFEDLENDEAENWEGGTVRDEDGGRTAEESPETTLEQIEYLPEKQSLDILQIFTPVLINSAKSLTPSMSNLQVAVDNLQSKCRLKNAVFRSLLEELKDKLDRRCCDEILKRIIPDFVPGSNLFEVDDLDVYDGRDTLLKIAETRGSQCANYVKHRRRGEASPRTASPDFSHAAPITVLRKVGTDGIFIEWDTRDQPSTVIGFEICVNGNLHHRVRSATRNKALLNNLDLTARNTISLYSVSARGRSVRCTSVAFPDATK